MANSQDNHIFTYTATIPLNIQHPLTTQPTPHTGEINEQEENQEEFVTKRTKYFELCLVDFEMCGPDIL